MTQSLARGWRPCGPSFPSSPLRTARSSTAVAAVSEALALLSLKKSTAAPALLSLKNGQGEVDKPDLYQYIFLPKEFTAILSSLYLISIFYCESILM